MIITELLAHEVRQLVHELTRQGVKLPTPVVAGCEHLDALDQHPLDQPEPETDLLELTTDQLVAHWERRAYVVGLRDALGGTARELAIRVARQMLTALRADLDQVLDQLRPDFDQAAAGVRRALELGIHAGSTPDAVLDLDSAASAAAWRRLPDQLRHLDTIGRIRIRLADLLDAPAADPFTDRRPYAASFTSADPGAAWDTDADRRSRLPAARWLRLSSTGPVRLLTVAETEAAAARIRVAPSHVAAPVLADFDVDAEAAAWRAAGDPITR